MVTEFGQVITLIDLIMVELGTAAQADLGGTIAQAKHAERITVNVRVVSASCAGRYRRFTTFGCSVIKVGVVVHGHDYLRRFFVLRNSPATLRRTIFRSDPPVSEGLPHRLRDH